MSNVTEMKKSLVQQAKDEFEKEQNEKAIRILKSKLKEKSQAQTILKNLEREIDDLVAQIESGDIPE